MEEDTRKKNDNWNYIQLERSRSNWKIVAWIFIILFILETLIFGALLKVGMQEVAKDEQNYNNKLQCSNSICTEVTSDAFIYDEVTKTCYCYNDQVVVLQRWIG